MQLKIKYTAYKFFLIEKGQLTDIYLVSMRQKNRIIDARFNDDKNISTNFTKIKCMFCNKSNYIMKKNTALYE